MVTSKLKKFTMPTMTTTSTVKVQDTMMYGWYMILCQFLDNSDSPSVVEQ